MAATHHPTRRTRRPNRTRYRRPLRLSWGAAGLTVLVLYIAARTWPIHATVIAALIATASIVRAIRPRRLGRLWNALDRLAGRRQRTPLGAVRQLATFQRLSPAQFEAAIAQLAAEDPHVYSARTVGGANDRGADVLVQHADGRRILIQCKRHQHGNNVGSDTVQTINGVYQDIHHCHEAAIVTTAGFTRAAIDTNAMLPQPIRLINGQALVQWANGGPPPWR